MSCGIYKIENLINHKVYIGQSCNIEKRKEIHFIALERNCHQNEYLQRSYNKYGIENFSHEIIEECSEELLSEREIYWINYYDSYNNGYNLTEGGYGIRGYHHNKDTRVRMSKSQKDRVRTDEEIEKIRRIITEYNTTRDYHHSEETKNKISNAVRKFHEKNPGLYSGENSSFYGKHHTEEWKKNMSERFSGSRNPMYGKYGKDNPNTGKKRSEESLIRLSVAHKGIKHTESQKKKIGNNTKGRKYMNNGLEERRVKPDEIQSYLDNGWKYGRVKKVIK